MTQKDRCSDAVLFTQWAEGSRTAGAALVERYFETVHRFFRTKASLEIDDMVQQTFLGCLEARERFRAESSFKTFLLAIARNQLFKHYRRLRDRSDFSPSALRDLGTSPSGLAAKRQDEMLLAEALDRLPRGTRLILELAYWEELDGAAIAQVLEVPLNTA